MAVESLSRDQVLTRSASHLVVGSTIPECFYRSYKREPEAEVYFAKEGGAWRAYRYADLFLIVRGVMGGLRAAGFQRGDRAAIFGENRIEWTPTDYAVQWLGGAVAAIYTTSSPDQIRYILNESQAKILFVSSNGLLSKLSGLDGLSFLKTIVVWDVFDASISKLSTGISLISLRDFMSKAVSEDEAFRALELLKPEDLSTLLYTSGTTGEPKGVMLTQSNIVENLRQILDGIPMVQPGKVTMSFLPLSHIYERVVHQLMVLLPAKVYFAESLDKLIDNISEVKPHIMTAVPRIFEKMYGKIMDRIKNSSWMRRKIFFHALQIGKVTFDYRYRHQPIPYRWRFLYRFADLFVFRKIRAITGGRAEAFVSGGAPLSQEIAEFFFTAGFTILEGYGLSETCILSVNRPEAFKFGTVGMPFRETEIRIDSDGEICARGPQVMKGYFMRPDATADVIDADGWFHTGDIGEFDSEGFLKITDRKKDLIVTAGGKKIAPQPIENSLKKDPMIDGICLVGDKKKYIVALVVPQLELARSWGGLKGESILSLSDCSKSQSLLDHFKREIERVNAELPRYSTIKDFRILDKPFTIEGGELTPTLKLKRKVIQEKYTKIIDEMYATDLS